MVSWAFNSIYLLCDINSNFFFIFAKCRSRFCVFVFWLTHIAFNIWRKETLKRRNVTNSRWSICTCTKKKKNLCTIYQLNWWIVVQHCNSDVFLASNSFCIQNLMSITTYFKRPTTCNYFRTVFAPSAKHMRANYSVQRRVCDAFGFDVSNFRSAVEKRNWSLNRPSLCIEWSIIRLNRRCNGNCCALKQLFHHFSD